jgi:hypothetical protein
MKKAIKNGFTFEEWAKNASIKVNKMPNIVKPKGPPPVVKLREAIEKGSYDRKFKLEQSSIQAINMEIG